MAESRLAGGRRMAVKWLPVTLWAGAIFVFSTDLFSGSNTAGVLSHLIQFFFPGVSPQDLAYAHFLMRKLGHFGEYFILALLLMRALRDDHDWPPGNHRLILAALLVTLYAISDEFHQSFVPSRGASVADVFIDVCGGICGIYWSHRRHCGKYSP